MRQEIGGKHQQRLDKNTILMILLTHFKNGKITIVILFLLRFLLYCSNNVLIKIIKHIFFD